MVQGKFKSGRYARVHVKVPGGATVLRFNERRPKQAHCANCGKTLPGIPRFSVSEARNSPKTQKRPERPFGGQLCSRCMRRKIIEKSTKRVTDASAAALARKVRAQRKHEASVSKRSSQR